MGSVKQSVEFLDTAWKILRQRYEETRQEWHDPSSSNFNRDYWEPLAREVEATQKQMYALAQIIEKAQRELRKQG
jgi:hypothetical protein